MSEKFGWAVTRETRTPSLDKDSPLLTLVGDQICDLE